MSLVQGGDKRLKCFGSLGFLTVEYLCINKLGVGAAGFSSHFSSQRRTPFAISAWRPTVEGHRLIAMMAGENLEADPIREFDFFQAHLNRTGETMRRFCEQPSSVSSAERWEMIRFVEAFCALCGYSNSDEVVKATRDFIEVESKGNMNTLTQAALRKVATTQCFSPEFGTIIGTILSSTLRSAF